MEYSLTKIFDVKVQYISKLGDWYDLENVDILISMSDSLKSSEVCLNNISLFLIFYLTNELF